MTFVYIILTLYLLIGFISGLWLVPQIGVKYHHPRETFWQRNFAPPKKYLDWEVWYIIMIGTITWGIYMGALIYSAYRRRRNEIR